MEAILVACVVGGMVAGPLCVRAVHLLIFGFAAGVFWGAAGAAGRFTRGTTLSVGIDAATDLVAGFQRPAAEACGTLARDHSGEGASDQVLA